MSVAAENQPLVAVLAAGRASRFGGGKLDANCAGKPVGRWVLDAVAEAGLAPGVIVTGPLAPAFAREAQGWDLLVNPEPATGLGSSVALAVREAAQRSRDILLLLADMPLVEPAYLREIAEGTGNIASRYSGGRPGVPARIGLPHLPEFFDLSGDSGARSRLAGLQPLQMLDCPPEALVDIDSKAELRRAQDLLVERQARRAGDPPA